MTVFSTRCCEKAARCHSACSRALVALWLALACPPAAQPQGIEVRSAAVAFAEDALRSRCDVRDRAHPHAGRGAEQGRAALFPARVRADPPALVLVQRERRPICSRSYRLSYNALTRQYRARRRHALSEFRFARRSARSHEPRAAPRGRRAGHAPARTAPIRRRCACGSTPRSCPKPFQLNALGVARLEHRLGLVSLDGDAMMRAAAARPALSRARMAALRARR